MITSKQMKPDGFQERERRTAEGMYSILSTVAKLQRTRVFTLKVEIDSE